VVPCFGVGGIEVWIVDLDQGDSEVVDPPIEAMFGEILSDDEIARARRLIRPRDRLRFGRCRAAVRTILGQLEGITPSSLKFGSGPHGKPYVEGETPNGGSSAIEFNVSHSGGLALIAATRGRSIGVDLEQIRAIREADRIIESFFTKVEQAQFAEIAAAERDAAFMRGWTRKEAILKGLGKGLAGGPSRYETMFGTSRLSRRFEPVSPRPIVDQWMLWEVAIGDGYVATLAAAIDHSK
jgi:4'-phosphopantetheinyl transferase